ncbi:MAG: acetate--CoA ligase family protein, partial [Desulfobacterales bacterium]
GNRVAIITNAGGPGIVATDMTISSGLKLARFNTDTIEALTRHLPVTANLNNPVDVIGDASYERYENALAAVIQDQDVDGALVILTPQSMTDALATAEAIVRVARGSNKPILCCFMGIIDVSPGIKYLQEHGYPVFNFPEDAAKAFAALYEYSQWVNREHLPQFTFQHHRNQAETIIQSSLAAGKTYLGELDGTELLKCYGFHVLPTELARNDAEAAVIAANMTFPVVMKIVSPQILHKSDANGVIVGLKNKDEVKRAFNQIVDSAAKYDPSAVIDGVLIQKMALPGTEAILGMNRYPIFGPLLMFGLGGIYVEVFEDVVFRLAPVGRNEARRMSHEIKGFKLFEGFRGRPKADLEVIEKSLVSLSDMVVNHPEISEMDINPLLIHEQGKGATVADCRIILKEVN